MENHLSHFNFDTNPELLALNESFLDEQLMNMEVPPWFIDIVNYLITTQLLEH